MNKLLVIAAHPDDELLGLGATIKKKVEEGWTAYAIVLGEGLTSRKANRKLTSDNDINQLHLDGKNASKIVGFKDIYFESLPDNRFDSVNLLDVIKIVETYIKKYNPDIIYTHHPSDRNIDHRITYDAVLTATRPLGSLKLKKILTFQTPSSTEWGFQRDSLFKPNVFEDVTNYLDFKIEAMLEYKSETRDFPHPRSSEALKTLAASWGIIFGVKFAEAFELIWELNK